MTDRPEEFLDNITEKTAALLVQAAANSAFTLFRDEKFRKHVIFQDKTQTEQDRIFNELSVSFLTLIMLIFDAPDLRVADQFRPYLVSLRKRIPLAHLELLRNSGVEEKYVRIWEKLTQMRYEEYTRDKHEVRSAAIQIESAEKTIDLDDLAKIQMLVPIQSVAIGCHRHVCRGETEGKDELFKLILNMLSRFYVEFRVRLEGGKITLLTKARVALRRIYRRIF